MKKKFFTNLLAGVVAIATSCSTGDTWRVTGNIDGAADSLLVLEESHSGHWTAVDSVRLDAKGNFLFKQPVAGYPDIYRLSIGEERIYFPIDSTNEIMISASLPGASTNAVVSGSTSSDKMMQVNRMIASSMASSGSAVVTDSLLKHQLAEIILEDASGVVAYYIINKEVAGHPLYDPLDKRDVRVIGAVANAFNAFRPDDPRSRYLQDLFIAARRASGTSRTTMEATEVGYVDLSLTGRDGQRKKISDLAGQGKPVLVNFTAYASEKSPAVNVALAKAFNAGLADIYQVSVDTDEYLWREASANLPWTAVLILPADGNAALQSYNVTAIPSTFIIDRNGVLKERVTDLSELNRILAQY